VLLTSEAQQNAARAYRARVLETAQEEFPYKPMSNTEYLETIEKLDLTQERAGVWLGLSPRQGQRYGNGEAEIPGPVAKLLRLVDKMKIELRKVQ
jgi:DNA-binding transcriptional regulator YiaG